MPPAQLYHWLEVNVKMRLLNLGKPAEVPKLNETMAIELGAELLGETIIFGIAALTIVGEYIRQSLKEKDKEFHQETRLKNIEMNVRKLQETMQDQNILVEELKQLCEEQKFSLGNLINKIKKETRTKETLSKPEESPKKNTQNISLINSATEDIKGNIGLHSKFKGKQEENIEDYSCLICKKYGFKTKPINQKKDDKIEKILNMPTSLLQMALFDAVKAIKGVKSERKTVAIIQHLPETTKTLQKTSKSIIQEAILDASSLIIGNQNIKTELGKKFYPINYVELDLIKEIYPLQNAIDDALDVLFGEVHLPVYNVMDNIGKNDRPNKYKIENYYQSNIFHDALDEAVEYIIREED